MAAKQGIKELKLTTKNKQPLLPVDWVAGVEYNFGDVMMVKTTKITTQTTTMMMIIMILMMTTMQETPQMMTMMVTMVMNS